MRTAVVAPVCILASLMLSCAASQEVTSFWRAPEEGPRRSHTSVFIMAMTADRNSREVVENDLAEVAAKHGLKSVRSVEVFPTIFTLDSGPTREDLLAKAKESGCDAIFTLSLLDVKSDQRYVPETMGYETFYRPRFDYYGQFSGYYRTVYPVVMTPGYHTVFKTYFVEANLFDLATERILWSMQSAAYNPKDINDFSEKYAKLLIARLEKENETARSD